MPVAPSILDTVGGTPLIALRRLPPAGARVAVKWEAANPSGSVKIRPALHIVERAEELGLLGPGSTIIESTSGNFGVALAMIGAVRGYRVVIVTDPKMPPPFLAAMRAYGAELRPVDRPDASGGYFRARLAEADRLAREIPDSFRPDQHFSLLNPVAHHASTGPELLAGLDGALPDHVVVAVSTAGQLRGIASYLRRHSPATRLVAVDARGSAALGGPTHAYLQTGIGLAWTPSNLDLGLVDEAYKVPDEVAFAACRLLAREEGLLAGVSSGSVVAVALALAGRAPGALIAAVLSDGGDRYLQTAYDEGWRAAHGLPAPGLDELRARCAELTPVRCEQLTGLDGGSWSPDTSTRPEPTQRLNALAAAALKRPPNGRRVVPAVALAVAPGGPSRGYMTGWLEAGDSAGLTAVVRLICAVSATDPFVGFPAVPTPEQAHALTERLASGLAAGRSSVLVICADGVAGPIGCAVLHRSPTPNQAHIGELATGAVHPDHRAAGVAALGMRAIVSRCRQEGVSLLRLDVREGIPAERIWRGFGFAEYGRLEDYGRTGGTRYAGVLLAQQVSDLARRLDQEASHARP